ncbi:MAG: DsbA family protein [Paracoccaceae bacterium]|nr:DsbA family protein [Paracoccaceae bacterium]
MTKKLALVAVAVAMIAGGAWLTNGGMGVSAAFADGTTSTTTTATTTAPAPTAAATDTKAPVIPEMSIGNPDAKVTVTEYLSFTCPHCEEFHAAVYPEIKKNYIDTGKIKFTIQEVYFDKYGLWAGMMAHCGGPMRYFGIVDILYNTQRDWAGTNDPNAVVASLKKIGKTAGMTDAELNTCMNDGKMAQALVAQFQKTTQEHKIEGTPSFVIDGVTHTNMGYDEFSKILDAELAKNK